MDAHLSKATVPILYGSPFRSKTTMLFQKSTFGFISKRSSMGGLPMWGIIARKRVAGDGRKPKQLCTTC